MKKSDNYDIKYNNIKYNNIKYNNMKLNGCDKSQNRRKWRCTPFCVYSKSKYVESTSRIAVTISDSIPKPCVDIP
jgi:hypothetical protein